MSSSVSKEFLCIEKEDGVAIGVYVQPRSSRISLEELREGELKIALTAPPTEGKANKQLITFLSKLLNVKKANIQITKGEKSRKKTVKIKGVTCKELIDRLSSHLSK